MFSVLIDGFVLCCVVLCCVVSCRVVSCRVVSCRVVSGRVVSCRVGSGRVVLYVNVVLHRIALYCAFTKLLCFLCSAQGDVVMVESHG